MWRRVDRLAAVRGIVVGLWANSWGPEAFPFVVGCDAAPRESAGTGDGDLSGRVDPRLRCASLGRLSAALFRFVDASRQAWSYSSRRSPVASNSMTLGRAGRRYRASSFPSVSRMRRTSAVCPGCRAQAIGKRASFEYWLNSVQSADRWGWSVDRLIRDSFQSSNATRLLPGMRHRTANGGGAWAVRYFILVHSSGFYSMCQGVNKGKTASCWLLNT